MKRIIGIDASNTNTGVCVINYSPAENGLDKIRDVSHDNLKFSSKIPVIRRIMSVAEYLNKNIQIGDVCAVEDFAIAMRNTGEYGYVDRIKLMGVIEHSLAVLSENIPFYVHPKVLKKFVTGNGGADKKTVKKCLLEKWGIPTKNFDQADATGAALVAVFASFPDELVPLLKLTKQVDALSSFLESNKTS